MRERERERNSGCNKAFAPHTVLLIKTAGVRRKKSGVEIVTPAVLNFRAN
jgi:hypothetical protein